MPRNNRLFKDKNYYKKDKLISIIEVVSQMVDKVRYNRGLINYNLNNNDNQNNDNKISIKLIHKNKPYNKNVINSNSNYNHYMNKHRN